MKDSKINTCAPKVPFTSSLFSKLWLILLFSFNIKLLEIIDHAFSFHFCFLIPSFSISPANCYIWMSSLIFHQTFLAGSPLTSLSNNIMDSFQFLHYMILSSYLKLLVTLSFKFLLPFCFQDCALLYLSCILNYWFLLLFSYLLLKYC